MNVFVEQSPWNNPSIFAHFFALNRPRISVYKRGRDATCCVRKTEDELAGQARKDTDSELFANNRQMERREVMQKSGVFVAQTNRLVQKNGDTHLFLCATLGD